MTDHNTDEWDFCDPKPPVQCPRGGVIFATDVTEGGTEINIRAFCVENDGTQLEIESDSFCKEKEVGETCHVADGICILRIEKQAFGKEL